MSGAMSVRGYSRALTAINIIGVLLSVYALYVEMALEAKPGYKALCDISERMSCTKVLGSSYARGFGVVESVAGKESVFNIPNCAQGVVFYLLMIFLATFEHTGTVKLQLLLSALSVLSSAYLAYILYFVLYDLCVVCVSTYLVNIAGLLLLRGKLVALRTRAGLATDKKQKTH